MVFVMGNHSSGKSTFINYLLQQKIQKSGVAPTDDGFTIIAPSNENQDHDGPSLVGHPDLGFSGLQQYGQMLVNHVMLKERKGLSVKNIWFVDSPGMIDNPNSNNNNFILNDNNEVKNKDMKSNNINSNNILLSNNEGRDRGYDFIGVTKWFAERADVILFFFDPDKPGTTGETLEVLTKALPGYEHKLHIILNKADQFSKIHDYGRAYGALCWNLSKVIPRKDLPRIYTMYVPESDPKINKPLLSSLVEDLDRSREDVKNVCLNAPKSRDDNLITRLLYYSQKLKIHIKVLHELKAKKRKINFDTYFPPFITFSAIGSLTILSLYIYYIFIFYSLIKAETYITMGIGACSIILPLLLAIQRHYYSKKSVNYLLSDTSLRELFEKAFFSELAERNEFSSSLFEKMIPQIRDAGLLLCQSSKIKLPRNTNELDDIVKVEVPKMRRLASPGIDNFKNGNK